MVNNILKYSQQLIAYFSNGQQLLFNGFFAQYNEFIYFVTVNHGVAPDLIQADNVHFILHANAVGISTRTIQIKNWQFIDLYKACHNKGIYELPIHDERIDIAFCSVRKEEFASTIAELPFILKEADNATKHHKSFSCIMLPQNIVSPAKHKVYYVAGKILHRVDEVHEKYDVQYFANMEYVKTDEGIYEFRITQPTDYAHCAGLSGSPVFDEDEKFVGMAIRYREEDNVLLVLTADNIAYYLHNDCILSPEELEYYNQ